ncbi:MAG: prkC 18 [Myxococcales bacterium]|nr:prkC 18 [Myxococcales bacterium]
MRSLKRWFVIAIVVAGCGRFRFDERGNAAGVVDAPSADACSRGAWRPPRNLSELNTTGDEFGGWVSEDGLEIWFSIKPTSGQSIFRARRTSTTVPFGTPTRIDFGLSGIADDPFQSDDGLTLYFEAAPLGSVTDFDFYVATRATTSVEFTVSRTLDEINSAVQDTASAVTSDQRTIIFSSVRAGGLGQTDLWQATRSSTADRFSAPQLIAELATTGFDCCPSPSSDGSSLLYISTALSPSNMRLLISQRSGNVYQPPVLFDPIFNSTANESDPTLTRNGAYIVFSSDRPGGTGGWDLYMAERPCL